MPEQFTTPLQAHSNMLERELSETSRKLHTALLTIESLTAQLREVTQERDELRKRDALRKVQMVDQRHRELWERSRQQA